MRLKLHYTRAVSCLANAEGRLLIIILLLLVLTSSAVAQSINQKTEGWCSPTVAEVGGSVTIICQGVDPKALERLNELLDLKDIKLEEKIKEANEWASKYQELKSRIESAADSSELSRNAKVLIENGEFEKAGEILDKLIAKQEDQIELLASNHFNRAELFALQFQQNKAAVHYEKAYRYRPENPEYGYRYAGVLLWQGKYSQAEEIYASTLNMLRKLNQSEPEKYSPNMAQILKKQGELYRRTNQFTQSEQAIIEASKIYLNLAKSNLAVYAKKYAGSLLSLGHIYLETERYREAARAYNTAQDVMFQLIQFNANADLLRDWIAILGAVAAFQMRTGDYPAAEKTISQAVTIDRALVKMNLAYKSLLANDLNMQAAIFSKLGRSQEALEKWSEALRTFRVLPSSNSPSIQSNIAMVLSNLGTTYDSVGRSANAEKVYKESLSMRRKLATIEPEANIPDVATTLLNLGALYIDTQRFPEAEQALEEASKIFIQLAEKKPEKFHKNVAFTKVNLCSLFMALQRWEDALQANKDAEEILYKLFIKTPDGYLPHVAGNLTNLGVIYYHLGQFEEAEKSYQSALSSFTYLVETNPGGYLQELGGTHRNLGHLYSKIGRLKEAAQEYEKAIDIYQKISTGNLEKYVPVVLELMNLLGNVYLKDERPDEAQQVFDEARRSGNGGIPSDKDTEPKP